MSNEQLEARVAALETTVKQLVVAVQQIQTVPAVRLACGQPLVVKHVTSVANDAGAKVVRHADVDVPHGQHAIVGRRERV